MSGAGTLFGRLVAAAGAVWPAATRHEFARRRKAEFRQMGFAAA